MADRTAGIAFLASLPGQYERPTSQAEPVAEL